MIDVRWTPQASDDLQAIYNFIFRDSPHYARLVTEKIINAADQIERFPQIGRVVPELGRDDIREVIHPPYRIVYRVSEVAHILTVFRASRSFPEL